jgi:hypothetical protein
MVVDGSLFNNLIKEGLPTNQELNSSFYTRSCAKSCTWGLAELTRKRKSSGVLVYLSRTIRTEAT